MPFTGYVKDSIDLLPQDEKLPTHLAIIMDGNGRWAKERMMRRIVGHRQGVQTVRTIVEECSRIGIRYLTLYAFSTENWRRPRSEVAALMSLLKRFVREETPRMMANDIRFNVIGEVEELPPDVQREIATALEETSLNRGLTLTLALSYGARQEIVRGVRDVALRVARGELDPAELTVETFARFLQTATIPDPDLMIRTSGEMRISNFLLWQMAYTELWFCDVHWPDFSVTHLHDALRDFRTRERRFGRTGEQLSGGRCN
ncbi:MAG: isoprenyl transferase [Desulfuromonadia bacterium]